MSTWEDQSVPCGTCGATMQVKLLKGMHITRLPEVKASIRDGTFQVFRCEACGARTHVEKATIYTDFEAGHYVGVELPDTVDWREAKQRHCKVYDEAFMFGPPIAAELATHTRHRLVFGLRALREKILAWDAGLDDRLVEVAKLELAQREGLSLETDVLRLVAILPPGDHLLFARFTADAPQGPAADHRTVLRSHYDGLMGRRAQVQQTFPWVFDDWFVDATHRIRHPG